MNARPSCREVPTVSENALIDFMCGREVHIAFILGDVKDHPILTATGVAVGRIDACLKTSCSFVVVDQEERIHYVSSDMVIGRISEGD